MCAFDANPLLLWPRAARWARIFEQVATSLALGWAALRCLITSGANIVLERSLIEHRPCVDFDWSNAFTTLVLSAPTSFPRVADAALCRRARCPSVPPSLLHHLTSRDPMRAYEVDQRLTRFVLSQIRSLSTPPSQNPLLGRRGEIPATLGTATLRTLPIGSI
jgi:hypothetical protein